MKRFLAPLLLSLPTFPALAAPETHQLARADGSLIHYTLDRPADPVGLLVLSQGSGCRPGVQSPGLATVRKAFPAYTALIVEKVGIAPDMTVDEQNCPSDFYDRYNVSQRIADYEAVMATLPPADRLVFFGGSEGGLAMAMLATRLDPDAVIILSSATGSSFGEMVKSTVPPEGHASIDAGFAAARANPDSSERFGGHAYRFWADILDRRSTDYMRRSRAPFLLIQGGLDTSSPLAAARSAADAFAAEGRCNLTYWEFPALDHGMIDPRGTSRLAAIATLAATWAEQPLPAC